MKARKNERNAMEKLMSVNRVGGVNVVRFFFNEINLEQRESIKKDLNNLLHDGEKAFIIDLSKVGFLSSLLIALIVFFAKEIHKKDGEIKLSGLSNDALDIFELTQLDKIFELYETERDALESFKKSS